jgi:hypothetical protein
MNPVVLTKVSKFTLIGSLSAFLAFASKFNPKLQQGFIYLYAGTLLIFILAALWEGREQFSKESPEDSLINLIPSVTPRKPKRQYLFSPNTRLEIVIGFVVVTACALIGAL